MDIGAYIKEYNKNGYPFSKFSEFYLEDIIYNNETEEIEIHLWDKANKGFRIGKTHLFYRSLRYTDTLYIDYFNFDNGEYYTKPIRLKKGKPMKQGEFNREITELVMWCKSNLNMRNRNEELKKYYYKGE